MFRAAAGFKGGPTPWALSPEKAASPAAAFTPAPRLFLLN